MAMIAMTTKSSMRVKALRMALHAGQHSPGGKIRNEKSKEKQDNGANADDDQYSTPAEAP
jgi:hypothetical protein